MGANAGAQVGSGNGVGIGTGMGLVSRVGVGAGTVTDAGIGPAQATRDKVSTSDNEAPNKTTLRLPTADTKADILFFNINYLPFYD